MLRSTIQHRLLRPPRGLRRYSPSLAGIAPAAAATKPPASSSAPRPAYYIPRNTRGSIPVYTDQANTKYMTLIRNIEGDVNALATDLKRSLFKPDSPEAQRLRIETRRNRHIVLSGGKWKREVFDWLKTRGF